MLGEQLSPSAATDSMSNIASLITELSKFDAPPGSQDRIRILLNLLVAVDHCPVADIDPQKTIECLLPYFAPLGTQNGDPVPPESSSDAHQTVFSGVAITALASIVRRYRATPQWPKVLELLVACWSATVIALLFYSRGLLRTTPPAAREIDSPAHTFTAIVTLLRMYSDIGSLANLLRSTREVTGIMIRLWAVEVKSPNLAAQLHELFADTCPPTAAVMLRSCLFGPHRLDGYDDATEIFALEGSLKDPAIAEICLEHIRRKCVAGHLPNLQTDLRNLLSLQSTTLHSHLIGQNSIGVATETLVHLTSNPIDPASAEFVTDCISQICEYLQKYLMGAGIVGLRQSLESGLLIGILRCHSWIKSEQPVFKCIVELLSEQIPRYFVYISILREVHKSFRLAQELSLNGSLPVAYRGLWLGLEAYACGRIKLAADHELNEVVCSREECELSSSLRCGNCWEAAYCSQQCQAHSWTKHQVVCQVLTNARLHGISAELDYCDVQFALRIAQRDFEHHKANICKKWTEHETLPLTAGIDYSIFPHAVYIEAPDVVRTQMASDAAIYAVFSQGLTGKEYYMCDLGLSRGAENTDEETIAAVVQIVSAQPIPAFFPIN
ncbi:hypothetical protein R3P38DRAFT_3071349 [Favolaschia claudopus]|uniref:MYND-type domain-containing protein n=1 Tax=Favolaschia claudopus TaxID=2862362 RepID=A0AAW0A0N4_9AGAR